MRVRKSKEINQVKTSAIQLSTATRPVRGLLGAAAVALALAAGAALAQQPAPEAAAERDAKAIDAITSMGKYLRSLKEFGVRAETSTDEVLTTGQKLQFGGTVEYKVRQPDHVRADVRNDRVHRQFFYDGATLTQYAPQLKFYSSVKAPATIGATLQLANDKLGITLPLADLFYWGTEKSGIADIKSAALIGPAVIGGVECDHYAFRQTDVDWQVWIARGQRPLPLKLVITTLEEPSQPQFTSVLKWDTQSKFDAKTFVFAAPKDAHRIEFASSDVAAAKK
jgi:hypothetical protein